MPLPPARRPQLCVRLVALGLAALLAGGCASVPSPFAEELTATARAYKQVRKGVELAEIEAQLGPAARTDPDGALVWEKRYDDLNYALVRAWFDANHRVTRLERTRARGHRSGTTKSSSVVTLAD